MTLFTGQLANSQDLSARTEDITEQGYDFDTSKFATITQEEFDALKACDTDGSGTCDVHNVHEQLRRRRRWANHAHKAHKAQKKGDRNYFYNFIDVKILSVKITFLLVKITFMECPILATSTFFSV